MVTVRCLLNLDVLNCCHVFQLDVINDFLYGDLVKTVYIKPPEGYFHAGDNKVYRLKKSLYGWKQAPRKYVLDLLSQYGMLACKPAKTPLQSKLVVSNEATIDDPLLFMHYPLKSYLKTTFKILRYLKGSLGLGIHITKGSSMTLKAYSDVDWVKYYH
ncbi:ribonuclease H-like domain-containing protein [Tanacetum coccineum]